jgi:ABC-type transport system involved in multi-copper enzyme maturation permease subunit
MTTIATPHRARRTPPGSGSRPRRALDLTTAEWIKLWSLRSTYAGLVAAAVATLLIASAVAHANIAYIRQGSPHGPIPIDPVAMSFRGLALAQLIIATLGALAMTGEYGSGLIRSTFAAAPQRAAVLAAKYAVMAAVALVFGQLLTFGCFLATQAQLSTIHKGLSLGAPHALRATVAAGCYVGVVAVVGLAIGTLVRHTAAAIGVSVVLFFLVPGIASALPSPWDTRFSNALPSTAAQVLSSQHHIAGLLGTGWAAVSLIGYATVAPLIAAVILHRRDA